MAVDAPLYSTVTSRDIRLVRKGGRRREVGWGAWALEDYGVASDGTNITLANAKFAVMFPGPAVDGISREPH